MASCLGLGIALATLGEARAEGGAQPLPLDQWKPALGCTRSTIDGEPVLVQKLPPDFSKGNNAWSTSVATEAGVRYRFRVRYRLADGVQEAFAMFQGIDPSGKPMAWDHFREFSPKVGGLQPDWTELAYEFTAFPGSGSTFVALRLNSPGTAYWSQPTLEKVEGATAAAPLPDPSRTGNVTTVETFKTYAFDVSRRGTPLDMGSLEQTFFDGFDKMDIVAADGPEATWHAAMHGGFGAAKFLPPGLDGPYMVKDSFLTIRATKDEKGKWTAGIIQTIDRNGHGFAQQYGYFEASAKFPSGKGAWPAFWIKSANEFIDKTKTRTELDVVEWYGGDPKGVHNAVHLWPAAQKEEGYPLAKHVGQGNYYNLKTSSPEALTNGLLEGFHTYGCEVSPDWTIFYFDRVETGRFPTLPEFRTPLFMLVNLAIFEKEADEATSPKEMTVDYVAAYRRK